MYSAIIEITGVGRTFKTSVTVIGPVSDLLVSAAEAYDILPVAAGVEISRPLSVT